MIEGRTSASGFDLANQDERRPIIRMGIVLPQVSHGSLQRARHVSGLDVLAVELLHQLSGAAIVNVPKRQEQRRCARIKQSPL